MLIENNYYIFYNSLYVTGKMFCVSWHHYRTENMIQECERGWNEQVHYGWPSGAGAKPR